jgi:hypothetical protein
VSKLIAVKRILRIQITSLRRISVEATSVSVLMPKTRDLFDYTNFRLMNNFTTKKPTPNSSVPEKMPNPFCILFQLLTLKKIFPISFIFQVKRKKKLYIWENLEYVVNCLLTIAKFTRPLKTQRINAIRFSNIQWFYKTTNYFLHSFFYSLSKLKTLFSLLLYKKTNLSPSYRLHN